MRARTWLAVSSGLLLPLLPISIHAFAPAGKALPTVFAGGGGQADGERAPELTGTATDGSELRWERFEGRTVVLLFHTARTRYSTAALETLAKSLGQSPDLKEGTTVLLMVDDPEEGARAAGVLSATGFDVRVGLDEERTLVGRYHVVAFPSAFVVDDSGTIVGCSRGYSTFFGFHLVTACRYSLGLLDGEHFEALQLGRFERPDLAGSRAALHSRMDLRLVESGHWHSALPRLAEEAAKSEASSALLRLVAHLSILDGDQVQAGTLLDRLALLDADDPSIALLRMRMDLTHGQERAARTRLDELRTSGPRLDRVRGQILEQEGRWQEAATLYRDALDCFLYLPRE